MLLESRTGEQPFVHLEKALDGNARSCTERLDRPVHRLDVVEDLGCRNVGTPVAEVLGELCLQEPAPADLQSLDLRGRYRLGPE
jgi:hypothetical protein